MSELDYTLSPLKWYRKQRETNKKDMITIHHMAGNMSLLGYILTANNAQNSANYSIYSDGRVYRHMHEYDESYCSSSRSNDKRAITIEVANSTGAPTWEISDKAREALVSLLVDLVRRHNMGSLRYSGDKNMVNDPSKQNVTLHRWFSNTECPGPYIMKILPLICDEVNAKLNDKLYKVQIGAFQNKENAEKMLANARVDYPDAFIKEEKK